MTLISFLNINSKITAKRVKFDKKAFACNECLDCVSTCKIRQPFTARTQSNPCIKYPNSKIQIHEY